MKPVRKLLIVIAALVGLAALLVLLAFTAPVQTWVARRVVAAQPGLRAELDRVSVGLRTVRLSGVHARYAGGELTLPDLVAELPVARAALHRDVAVTRLVARGWTLDLTHYASPPPAPVAALPAPFSLVSSAYAAEPAGPAAAAATVFTGVFHQLHLPVDLALDGVVLEGEVILPPADPPAAPLHARLTLVGGGLAAGREGAFTISARLDIAHGDAPVDAMEVRGSVGAVMDTPRTFTKFTAKLDTQAKGSAFPQGVQLTTDLSAARVPGGESYSATVESVGKRLLDVQASYPEKSARLGGVWRLDVRDTDLAPFTLGRPLPAFEAAGSGMFETDTTFAEIHTAGRLKSSVDRLDSIRPELAGVGAVTLFGEFDLTQTAASTRLDRLLVSVNRPNPVLTVESMQPFEFNPSTGELKVADPAAALLAIDLQGVPLAWSQPFLPDLKVTGGDLRGRLTGSARDGGLLLRTQQPLAVAGLAVDGANGPMLRDLAVNLSLAGDYTPQGWQVDVSNLTATSAGSPVLTLAVKAGQPPGRDQALKATGRLTAELPALLRQPLLQGGASLRQGTATIDFSANLGAQQDLQLGLALKSLVGPQGQALPQLTSDLRLTHGTDQRLKFSAPLKFTNPGSARVSDLQVDGVLAPAAPGWRVDARVAGEQVYVDDLQLLAGLAGAADQATATPGPADATDAEPFWHGLNGTLTLALKHLHYGTEFDATDVGGTLRIDAGALDFDGVKAGLGEGSSATLGGGIHFDAAAKQPYRLAADVKVTDFNPAPLFRAENPNAPAQVDGRFNVSSQLAATGRNVEDLVNRTQGDVSLTSKGGVFRLLTADVATKVESVGKVAAIGAFIGNVASALGRKDASGLASNAEAVSELTKMLSAIQYDQLNVVMQRDADLNTLLKNFTLIAPELRLEGTGRITAQPGVSLLEQPLTMQFQMKARGHSGDVLKYLHALGEDKDDLGYATCTLPLNVTGTLAKPDTKELQSALTKLAVERSGAGDLLNKLLGK